MDYQQIKELIKIVELSEFTQFELELEGVSLKIGKDAKPKTGQAQPATDIKPEPSQESPVTIMPQEVKEVKKGEIVTAPLVGMFYRSPAPDKPSFVNVGDRVKKGDTLCIIEAMKIMNEITSTYDGEIAEVFANNDDMVEYSQPLFRIV